MLIEQIVIAFLDNYLHGSSEVINVPFINLVNIVLLQHHRIVHLPSIVQLFELIWFFDLKWLIDNFVEVLLLRCDVEPFLFLGGLASVLLLGTVAW